MARVIPANTTTRKGGHMAVVIHGRRGSEVARAEFDRTRDWLVNLERSGVIPPAPRDFAGQRRYPPLYVEQIKSIILTRRQGGQAA